MAQISGLFVPTAPEAQPGGKAALNAFDLAVPGSEDAGRVFKAGADNAVEHFADEQEALAVRSNLNDRIWTDANCASCNAPGATSIVTNRMIKKVRRAQRLKPRGAALSVCCKPPATITDFTGDLDEPDAYASLYYSPPSMSDTLPIHDASQYGDDFIPEGALVNPPDYITWFDVEADKGDILRDLNNWNTAVLAWSPEVTHVISSQDVFTMLREAFTGADPEVRYFKQLLKIGPENGALRQTTNSERWINTPTMNPDLQILQQFTNKTIEQGKEIARVLKGMDDEDAKGMWGTVDYYWIPPTRAALKNPDPRGIQ